MYFIISKHCKYYYHSVAAQESIFFGGGKGLRGNIMGRGELNNAHETPPKNCSLYAEIIKFGLFKHICNYFGGKMGGVQENIFGRANATPAPMAPPLYSFHKHPCPNKCPSNNTNIQHTEVKNCNVQRICKI